MAAQRRTLTDLERDANAGDARAQYILSAMLGRLGRKDEGRAWLARSASAGDVDALYTSACIHLDGVDGPRDIPRALEILHQAAQKNGAAAMRTLAVLSAIGAASPPNWNEAIGHLRSAAKTNDAIAIKQLSLIEHDAMQRPLPARLDLSRSPDVWRLDGLLTRDECGYLIEAVKPLLHPSFVVDPVSGRPMRSTERTSSTASIHPFQQDMVMVGLNQRLAEAAQLPLANGEMLSVLMYQPGEQYRPHFDFLDASAGPASQWGAAGQRVATLLVSLSDDFDGGETHFLANGLEFKGRTGDAILFSNVDAAGNPDLSTRHAGRPIARGNKWLLSKWYRAKAYAN